ncbi:MAG: undecaprenyl-diphosphate phosphatase [Chitinophagaceae bacterium]|nr:undecaprenyl-diphosphate phosphatase [Chitinophagaceae bacterium]MCW5914758.1 undecaprenyl-diphosphate phosphatase [Chitinophagaceae bacterium]MCZ2396303.1 undecaprenyl-diphosphate phosphatase [Chitinophagales bacterium]
MTFFQSIIIALVEGLTEFLPVSSTGHIIITGKLLGVPENDFTTSFTIAVQLGAILAVVVLYHKKFLQITNWQFYLKLIIGMIPAVILGLLLSDYIDTLLESATTVAITLLLGGIVLVFIDNFFNHPKIEDEKEVSFLRSFKIGLWQCLALIPGMSRSAASIIGGMQQKLTRSAAAEFSFFLGVPTLFGATVYKLYKYYKTQGGFTSNDIELLVAGNVVSFIVAILAIKFFINFLKKHGFRIWGFYRIVVGIILLIMIGTGYLK